MPWYVIWLLPLAALGTSVRLRRVALGLTVFLVLVFLPSSNKFWNLVDVNPLSRRSASQGVVVAAGSCPSYSRDSSATMQNPAVALP